MSMGPLLPSRRPNGVYPSDALSDFMEMLTSNRHSNFMENTQIQVDWKESPMAHIIKADLPGLTKEDVKIEVEEENRVLEISGEVSKKEARKNETYVFFERLHGSFSRLFRLPENAEIHDMKAKMEKGVLTIIIPKKPGRESRMKSIQILD